MPARKISLQTAKRLAITKQKLSGPLPKNPNRTDILDVMRDLTYIQIDPISAVARSHLLVLWSRLGKYNLQDLDELLWGERKLFEYFSHAYSIVLTEDYPIHSAHMRNFGKRDTLGHKRANEWMDRNRALRHHILTQLGEKGPLPSRSIEDKSEKGWRSSGWTNERNVNRMLEFLLLKGEVMVAGRSGIQKLWSLSERCLPSWTPKLLHSDYEVDRLFIQKSLRSRGVATQRQAAYTCYTDRQRVFNDLEKDGSISEVEVEGVDGKKGEKWYVHEKDISTLDRLENDDEWQPRTTLLSPFDNLIIDRIRTKTLFDFVMSFEIYVPKNARRFGYYVLPILHGDRIIGRIDPKMDRAKETLLINAVFSEPKAPKNRETARAVATTVEALGDFLGAKKIVYSKKVPREWKSELK
ncbi:MAG: winged helix-turn-helix domain-containing protein [Nitrososphaerales archaeon]